MNTFVSNLCQPGLDWLFKAQFPFQFKLNPLHKLRLVFTSRLPSTPDNMCLNGWTGGNCKALWSTKMVQSIETCLRNEEVEHRFKCTCFKSRCFNAMFSFRFKSVYSFVKFSIVPAILECCNTRKMQQYHSLPAGQKIHWSLIQSNFRPAVCGLHQFFSFSLWCIARLFFSINPNAYNS